MNLHTSKICSSVTSLACSSAAPDGSFSYVCLDRVGRSKSHRRLRAAGPGGRARPHPSLPCPPAAGERALRRHAVEKFVGDAVMAACGAPVAHEDDAERAVRAGLRPPAAADVRTVRTTCSSTPERARAAVGPPLLVQVGSAARARW